MINVMATSRTHVTAAAQADEKRWTWTAAAACEEVFSAVFDWFSVISACNAGVREHGALRTHGACH